MARRPRDVELLADLSDTTVSVYIAQDFEAYKILSGKQIQLGDIPPVSVHDSPFYGVDGWVKRAEDVLLAVPLLLACAVPWLAIAIASKLEIPGPVLYRQKRYGLNRAIINGLQV